LAARAIAFADVAAAHRQGDAKSMIHMGSFGATGKTCVAPLKPTVRFVKLRVGGLPLPAFPP
jgi:hypothetical protein